MCLILIIHNETGLVPGAGVFNKTAHLGCCNVMVGLVVAMSTSQVKTVR